MEKHMYLDIVLAVETLQKIWQSIQQLIQGTVLKKETRFKTWNIFRSSCFNESNESLLDSHFNLRDLITSPDCSD